MTPGMPGRGPGQGRSPGTAVSPLGGQGSAPPDVSPAAETPGLEATPARGSLTGPRHGPDTGAIRPGGPAGRSNSDTTPLPARSCRTFTES